ncbi:hypothetical protein Dimus_023871 [Dionaea muscipula]
MVDLPGGENLDTGEIMLFGVRVVVDSMRKSVSLNNLSQYEHHPRESSNNENSNDKEAVAGYVSADDTVHRSSSASMNNRERKRGVPWTEEEHKRFLIGLKKLGKGDWRGIAKNFVMTRTPTQVASHAQKYFIRRSNVNRRRRRSSLFDITTDSVTGTLTNDQDNISQSPSPVSTQRTSNHSLNIRPQILVPMSMVYPSTISPVILPSAADVDRTETTSLLFPMQISPTHLPTTRTAADFDLNMDSIIGPSLSLNLSLSSSPDQDDSSSPRRKQHSGFQITPNCRASIVGMA